MLQVMIPSEYQTGPSPCEFPAATPQMATHSQNKNGSSLDPEAISSPCSGLDL